MGDGRAGMTGGGAVGSGGTVAFGGDVATYYAAYRRGYPEALLDRVGAALGLSAVDGTVLDLGCGTGQLALPMAHRARAVIGMDPEPAMLRLAAEAGARQGLANVTWVLGADRDVPALGALLDGPRPLAATVIGTALHWMRPAELFPVLRALTRPGGGVAVLSGGAPLWLHGTDWSRALRAFLEDHFGRELRATCGTDDADLARYRREFADAGFASATLLEHAYEDLLTFDRLVGGLWSAFPPDALPAPGDRPAFAARLRAALPPGDRFAEPVRVTALVATVGPAER
ncbi:class I SAM-dependent methyltransferase [Streptomyces avicenniae]|uniref:class I SAM-dependent methyltransferase n=1 Tax=Streptomyces avicenniae TaxID=500153 RepID=UPI001CBA6B24|nr:class I SAM-dependent methyltransferase [Streptomyces avicenniae]